MLRLVPAIAAPPRLRREVRVRGRVQGVGFRPAICRFASGLSLAGFIRNDGQGVHIEVEGAPATVEQFLDRLPSVVPDVARIASVETTSLPVLGEHSFRIAPSAVAAAARQAAIPPDAAPCADCLRELDDPRDRRHRYPFINCTACGPRFTIVEALPYDRPRTTMARFALCDACAREYHDPRDRRFHAEAIACPRCGPSLTFADAAGRCSGEEALLAAGRALAEGRIVALKGVGGFQLAADARNAEVVAALRGRKRRPHKPFAVMGRSIETLERVVVLDECARAALDAAARPIVLAPARRDAGLAAGLAPGLNELGVALASTPLHHLLLADGPDLMVMTSGNVSSEPIARTNDEALERLAEVADAFLVHDREVRARADDSVVRVVGGAATVTRRARGFVPESFSLPFEAVADATVLAVGAELKTTLCLVVGRTATLSQHVGDLGDADVRAFFDETANQLCALAGVAPELFVHDLHPDYESSRWARGRARAAGNGALAVQHHHAHVATCLVEHGRTGPVLGVAFDGTGLGPDGTLWGGEILIADLAGFRRVGHLRPIALPGGEAAIRAPWRLAVAALEDAGEPLDLPALAAIETSRLEAVRRLAGSGISQRASGAGRWFDAVAALCGVRAEISYDGQAAMELEAAAAPGDHGAYALELDGEPFVVDLRPAVRAVAADARAGVSAGVVSARFHATMARALVAACRRARDACGLGTVALTGGCFQNRLLTEAARVGLEAAGFEVLSHRRVPCNDGGVALGQAAVAAFRLAKRERAKRCA
jgi:hydrogenase maturation protein HypF